MRKVTIASIYMLMAVLAFAQIQPAQAAKPTETTGPNNSITDVPGIEVGNFTDPKLTGTTVVLARKAECR